MQQYYEYAGNLHMHTPYSDGEGSHAEIAAAALSAGLDFVIVTDHNVLVKNVEGFYGAQPEQRVLILTGEEIHDMRRNPQRNHLLVYNTKNELSPHAANPQQLIDMINEQDGLSFIAHPHDVPAAAFAESHYSWEDRDVTGFTGLEIWNYMSEFKRYLTNRFEAVRAAFNPERYIQGPYEEALGYWDDLLNAGHRVVAIGNSDAHATVYSMGPISRPIFPYEYLFRCVNTHVISPHPFIGDLEHDSQVIYAALRAGNAFVGYDLPAPTRGFRFTAQGHQTKAIMGERIKLGYGVTLQIACPAVADIRLLHNGKVIDREISTHRTYTASKPGVYRIEAYIDYLGKPRGWIYSNPIYVAA